MPDNERDPYEYRSVFDGYPYGDDANDWTDRENAEDEAEVFRTLGKTGVRIVCRALDGGSPAVVVSRGGAARGGVEATHSMAVDRFARCDYCGNKAEMAGAGLPPGWFTLSQRRQGALDLDDEHHFCSVLCVEDWCYFCSVLCVED